MAVALEAVALEAVALEEVALEEVALEEGLVVEVSSKDMGQSARIRTVRERRIRTEIAPVAPSSSKCWCAAYWIGANRSSFLNAISGLVVATFLAATGCASVTSKLSTVPKLVSSSNRSATSSKHPQLLGNPENQSLQIALETARLAEERAMDAEAISAYQEVRQLDPEQPGVAHALAVLYDRAAMTDAALREDAASLVESPADVDVLCDYGYFLYSTDDLERAEEMLRRGIEVDDNHQKTTINLAVVLATRREYNEAKMLFEKAIGPAAALHNIGMFKLRQGDSAEGERMIAAALQKDPSLRQSVAVLNNVVDSGTQAFLASEATNPQR
ncbi:MAG: hypothetical protein P8L85_21425 [Rubripirellula sp.]|nr:hypothetical protein [Rubripirellula sp.]